MNLTSLANIFNLPYTTTGHVNRVICPNNEIAKIFYNEAIKEKNKYVRLEGSEVTQPRFWIWQLGQSFETSGSLVDCRVVIRYSNLKRTNVEMLYMVIDTFKVNSGSLRNRRPAYRWAVYLDGEWQSFSSRKRALQQFNGTEHPLTKMKS